VVHAAAHVTGGGIVENLPRVLPEGLEADVAWGSWPEPPVFDLLRAQTGAPEDDLRSTFNLGVGMVLVVPPDRAERAIAHAGGSSSAAFPIGLVRA
jgi:phosphoribosylformylglycinamidine cyclo-ligase